MRAEDATSAQLRARQLGVVIEVSPLMHGSSVLFAMLIAAVMWPSVHPVALVCWMAGLLLFSALAMWHVVRWRRIRPTQVRAAHVWRVVWMAAAMGLLWGIAPLLWFDALDGPRQLVMAVAVLALTCSGAFFLAIVPLAGLLWQATVLTPALTALLHSGEPVWYALTAMMVFNMLVVTGGSRMLAHAFVARFTAEREAERQGQMVSLLLRDFEDHATDMLWEVNRQGNLTHISQRLVQLLGEQPVPVQGRGLMELLSTLVPSTQDKAGLLQMRRALVQDKPFRDLSLAVQIASATHWWSISAKPLVDESGLTVGWRGVISDVTQQRLAHQRLARLAHTDSLTGLANRVQLRERIAVALEAHGESPPRRSALICIDLDHFKAINDTLGHSWGDEVLRVVARRLLSVMRRADLVARLGGDEFAVVLDDVRSDDEVEALTRRLVQLLCQPCEVRGRTLTIGASLGVAMLPDHGHTVDEALGNADLALYNAKESGRGRVQVFSLWLGERSRRLLAVEQALRDAMGAGQFSLAWQPRVQVDGWQMVGAEVLLRWTHPTLGAIAPVEFIPLAEKSGLISEIGAWVLEQACLQAQRELPGLKVSVNVSPVQLMREQFLGEVERALRRSGLAPNRLEVEITESVFVEDAQLALTNLHGLKRLGVQISMDDFGTGYSSLAYLRRFPFDTLKIDAAFVRELLTHHDARAIVRTIVDLANTLGMYTVAEGVEEPAQLEVLAHAGCAAIQGYLVARPLPLQDLLAMRDAWAAQARPQAADVEVPMSLYGSL